MLTPAKDPRMTSLLHSRGCQLLDEDLHRHGAWFTARFRVGMGAVRVITLV